MDVERIREDFPILKRKINGHPLIYFDNTATTQKPVQVINAIKEFYEKYNANIHRGVHTLSQEASELYEKAHEKVADFINADWREVIFVRNTTEAINLVANILDLEDGEVVVSMMEHHSNLVPWQDKNLKVVNIKKDGTLDMEDLKEKITKKTKLVAITHVSNVLGTINPVEEIGKMAHEVGALFLVDGAQSVPHMPIDVRKMDCDFLAFSGHKMLGPTGIGVLYGKKDLLEELPPFLKGGDMISHVWVDKATWNELPWKYEAGTPNIAGGVGLGAAVDYLKSIGVENVRRHEEELVRYALDGLSSLGVEIYGPEERGGLISFNLDGIHPHDVAYFLDRKGIAVRSGHHCAQPLMRYFGIKGTVRASFYIYNTKWEIDKFLDVLKEVQHGLRR